MVQTIINVLWVLETAFLVWLFWPRRHFTVYGEMDTKLWFEEDRREKQSTAKSKTATQGKGAIKGAKRGRPVGVKNGQGKKAATARQATTKQAKEGRR